MSATVPDRTDEIDLDSLSDAEFLKYLQLQSAARAAHHVRPTRRRRLKLAYNRFRPDWESFVETVKFVLLGDQRLSHDEAVQLLRFQHEARNR